MNAIFFQRVVGEPRVEAAGLVWRSASSFSNISGMPFGLIPARTNSSMPAASACASSSRLNLAKSSPPATWTPACPRRAADRCEHARDRRAHVRALHLLHLLHRVPKHDVPDFVADHRRKLVQPVGSFGDATIHVDEAAGQRERVEIVRVHHVEMPVEIGGDVTCASESPRMLRYRLTTGSWTIGSCEFTCCDCCAPI